jgi:hypothetical protein
MFLFRFVHYGHEGTADEPASWFTIATFLRMVIIQ